MKCKLAVAVVALFSVGAQAQTLLYSLCYSETQASRQIRFPNGALGASHKDQLAMLRSCSKSDLYSVSFADGSRTLLFSDEGMDLEFWPFGPVLGRDKIYGAGILREWHSAPVPGVYAEPPTLYELSLDGSRRLRELIRLQVAHPEVALNQQGTRAAIRSSDGKDSIFIYELPSWKLLRTWELSKTIAAHCPDCTLISYGWLADGKRLFYNVTVVGDGDDSGDQPGIFAVSEDGRDLGAVQPGKVELDGYVHPNFVEQKLLAQLRDGAYLFEDSAAKKGGPNGKLETFLVISPTNGKKQKIFRPKHGLGTWVSPSERYLAYIENRQLADYRTEQHLWAIDLESGAEKELFVQPPPEPPSSPRPNVSLRVIGWIGNN